MPSRTSRNDTGHAAKGHAPDSGVTPKMEPFWRVKTLDTMTRREWESLCDRCGRCCLVKLEDEDTGEIHKTDIACKLFDEDSCACADYSGRLEKVSDCIKLTPTRVKKITWLPKTCAYRLIQEGKSLFDWHPLVSGSADSVHEAGISVRGRIGGSETTVKLRHYVGHIVHWDD